MEGDDRRQHLRRLLRQVLLTMRAILAFLALFAALLGGWQVSRAQSPIPSFPPGVFQNRAALDPVGVVGSPCGVGWTGPTSGLTYCLTNATADISGSTITPRTGTAVGTMGGGASCCTTGPGSVANAGVILTPTAGQTPITLSSNPMAGLGSTYTIAPWVNLTSLTGTGGDPRLVCFGTDATLSAMIATATITGLLDVAVKNSTVEKSYASALTTGLWILLGLTYDGTTLTGLINGTAGTGAAAGLGDGCTAATYGIGGRGDSSNRSWTGAVGRVMIYNRVLSGSDWTSLVSAN